MRKLTLSPAIAAAIRAHGAETYPHECCGGLIGRREPALSEGAESVRVERVMALVPLPNTTEEGPRRRFLVRPSDYRAAEKRASELDAELLGFYHSHPDHPARPSQYDLDHAWPTFAYVIVSVVGLPGQSGDAATAGVGREMTVWFLADDRSTFLEGTLTDGQHNPDSDTAPALYGQA